MTIVNRKLGEKIRKIRLKTEMTQEDLAFKAKLDYSYMNQIENGKRNPSVKALERIAKALQVSVKQLFE